MFDIKVVTSTAATDCGPCSLTSLLNYYGIDATLDDVKKKAPASLCGWSAGDILRAAKAFGLEETKAYKSDADSVIETEAPCICFWSYNHWIVYCGLDDNGRVVICNPARGRYSIDLDFFKALFSGVCIYGEAVPSENGENADAI